MNFRYCLTICLAILLAEAGFSQETNSRDEKTNANTNLRKVVTYSYDRDLNFDIGDEAWEDQMNAEIGDAIRSIEIELGDFEIGPIEMDLTDMDWHLKNIDIDPPVFELDDIEFDVDKIDFEFNEDDFIEID